MQVRTVPDVQVVTYYRWIRDAHNALHVQDEHGEEELKILLNIIA